MQTAIFDPYMEVVRQWACCIILFIACIGRTKDPDVTRVFPRFFDHRKPPKNQLKNATKFGFSKRSLLRKRTRYFRDVTVQDKSGPFIVYDVLLHWALSFFSRDLPLESVFNLQFSAPCNRPVSVQITEILLAQITRKR